MQLRSAVAGTGEIEMTTYSLPTMATTLTHPAQLNSSATLFAAARATAQRRGLWASLTRRSNALRTLPSVRGGHSAGRKLVPLNSIRGTEGRPGDFDDQFCPLSDQTRQRWQSVAAALDAGLVLPPVQLIQVGAEYYVRDGHHRVSVTRALGQDTIEAEVTVWNAD
jgi:hypothetical protein